MFEQNYLVLPASKVLFDELEDLDTKLKQFKADAKEEATSVKVGNIIITQRII